MRRVIVRVAVAGLVLGLLAGCGDDDDTTAGSTTTEGTLSPPFQDGTYFGYIVDTAEDESVGPYVDFDVARIVEGDAAAEFCGEGVDFCIDNEDETVRLVPLADDYEVLDIDYATACCDPAPATIDDILDEESTPHPAPVNVTIENSEVTRVEEMYFP